MAQKCWNNHIQKKKKTTNTKQIFIEQCRGREVKGQEEWYKGKKL